MLKAYLLRIHRWVAVIAAVPLLFVILTGLVLSFEPLAQKMPLSQPLTKERMLGFLAEHDAAGKATSIAIRRYEQKLVIGGVGEDGEVEIDLRTGEEAEEGGGWTWSEVFRTARRMHETLLLNLGWLVTASTIAMVAIGVVGIFMGLPRLRNTLGGWHTSSAWSVLPLAILSPLTGLAIVFGITFLPQTTGARPAPVAIKDAVVMIAEKHDLADLTSLRPRGGRLLARVYDGPVLTNYAVRPDGLQPLATNWPRALHEGNWHAYIGAGLNILVSIVFMGLWTTGLIIFARRKLRRRNPRVHPATPQPAE